MEICAGQHEVALGIAGLSEDEFSDEFDNGSVVDADDHKDGGTNNTATSKVDSVNVNTQTQMQDWVTKMKMLVTNKRKKQKPAS